MEGEKRQENRAGGEVWELGRSRQGVAWEERGYQEPGSSQAVGSLGVDVSGKRGVDKLR